MVDDRSSWYRLRLVTISGEESTVGPIEVAPQSVLAFSTLHAASDPGGDRPVSIRYRIGGRGTRARLEIFSVTGRLVRAFDQGFADPGEHLVSWDRRTDAGASVGRGTYFVRLATDHRSQAKKLVLVHR